MFLILSGILSAPGIPLAIIKGLKASIIFQEPPKSLNPVQSIGTQFKTVLKKQFKYNKRLCEKTIKGNLIDQIKNNLK